MFFEQLYTTRASTPDRTVPFVYWLMSKAEAIYKKMLTEVVHLHVESGLNSSSVVTGSEVVVVNRISIVFSNADIKSCFFYLNQCLYRQVQSYGLQLH